MTFIDWDGRKYLVKVKSYNIFKTISAADTKYHYLCSDPMLEPKHVIFLSDKENKRTSGSCCVEN